ncbi:MAG: hypothetical protein WBA74_01145 [Cyclobacteriaceae bacterium]
MSSEEIQFEQIERYLAGKMNADELQAFETSLLRDKSLKQEVALHRQLAEATIEHDVMDFRASVNSVMKDASMLKQSVLPNKILYLRIVATVSIILLIGYGLSRFFTDSVSNQPLFETYYEPYDDLITGRSDDRTDDTILLAMQYYNQADYSQAITYLEQIDQHNKPLLSLYLGICYLNLDDYEKAHMSFDSALETDNLFSKELRWYNALTYLKEGNTGKARLTLKRIINSPGKSGYVTKAQSLLDALD